MSSWLISQFLLFLFSSWSSSLFLKQIKGNSINSIVKLWNCFRFFHSSSMLNNNCETVFFCPSNERGNKKKYEKILKHKISIARKRSLCLFHPLKKLYHRVNCTYREKISGENYFFFVVAFSLIHSLRQTCKDGLKNQNCIDYGN